MSTEASKKILYEKIIHVCQERIRQLEAERPDAVEDNNEDAEPDYKTVICPSEKDKPKLRYCENAGFDGIIKVYSVFQSDGSPYAYLGYWGTAHVYLDLGRSHAWSYFKDGWLPSRSFGLSVTPLNKEDHASSMEIGDPVII